ncbi:activated protein kinase catalytic subunit alpha-1 [Seminavis robusta]|uniref:Activated protein kinase catalytic subunit alpha-1 n=1 Tax=Seminavis robusta TaxID=568900 RepID=A0A9N8ECR4_9STRA|nr:activated protein kinase catalytic subunit alpha-1 [Seminavis robusta]|eukprot:Sro958_g224620.1 activated protein kinase catalytic subunit alpha-1 (583) ;mRNA; f:15924-17672
MDDWDDFVASLDDFEEEDDVGYEQLEQEGPPVPPLEFPTPVVFQAQVASVKALDHRNGNVRWLDNVLMRSSFSSGNYNNRTLPKAFLVRKKISKTTYGSVRVAVVLRKRDDDEDDDNNSMDNDNDTKWISTEELVAIKISAWNKIRQLRGQQHHVGDPLREVAALQYVGNYNPHVVGCIETLQDDKNLYTIMPYHHGSNLHGRLFADPESTTNSSSNRSSKQRQQRKPNEDEARKIFRQLLKGLQHLQRKGVFHRDISLDNLLISKSNQLRIVDLSMSLRVPYSDPCNEWNVTDVSEGTIRRLLKPQGKAGGRLMYLAPEVLTETEPVDGFAVDLWAAGVILFVLCVGLAPFKFAEPREKRYAKISSGGLKSLMKSLRISLSPEACDLLQNMLWEDPRQRYTLTEVMKHPWVMATDSSNKEDDKIPVDQQQQAAVDNTLSSDAASVTSQSSTEPSQADAKPEDKAGSVAAPAATADAPTAEARQAVSEQREAVSAVNLRLKRAVNNAQRIGPKMKEAISKNLSGGAMLSAMAVLSSAETIPVPPDDDPAPVPPPNNSNVSPTRNLLQRLGKRSTQSTNTTVS